MAIYRLELKNGYTPIAHLKYIQREENYKNKEDLVYAETKNLPEVFRDIHHFWTSSVVNKRANARLYKEFIISLPKEFSDEENIKLTQEFTEYVFSNKYVYNYAIHNPKGVQPHAHIMFCERELDGVKRNENMFFARYNPKNPMLGGARKNEYLNSPVFLKETRKMWELFLNEKLLAKGLEEVSSETLEKQNIKRDPRKKMNLWNDDNKEEYEKLKKNKELMDEKYRLLKLLNILKLIDEKVKKGAKEFKKLLEEKEKLLDEIYALERKARSKRLKKVAYNLVTKGEYFKLLNERKKSNQARIKEIENTYRVDKIYLIMRIKYLKQIKEKKKELKILNEAIKELKDKMKNKPIWSLERLYYESTKNEVPRFQKNTKIDTKSIKDSLKQISRIRKKEERFTKDNNTDLDEYRYINIDEKLSLEFE